MEASTDVSTAVLTRAVAIATQSTSGGDQQTAATHDTQEQIGNRDIRNAVSATMGDIMDDPLSQIAHPEEQAYLGREDSNTHATHHFDNAAGLFVSVQDSELNSVSTRAENENEMQELGDGGESPILYSGNMGGDAQDNNEATDNHLPTANAEASRVGSSGHSPFNQPIAKVNNASPKGTFVDHDGDTEGTEGTEDMEVESDADEEMDDVNRRSAPERDHETAQHSYIGGSHVGTRDYPRTKQTIAEHLSIQDQHIFTSLEELLSSHNAPGRGLYKVEQVVKEKRRKAAELEEDIRCLQAQLEVVSELRDEARTVMLRACVAFSDARGAAGISNDLWAEYEAFCESLEPKHSSRDGWSVTCFQNHNNSYFELDSNFDLFKETAEMSLGDCNFRCEASTINENGSTEYVVEFWPLDRLEPRKGTAKTWEQQYPKLYRLAKAAVHNSFGDNTVAQELLLTLPNPHLPFASGWLFEYASEPARASHATLSRRWSYRRACRIPIDGQEEPPKGYLANTSESESTTSQKIDMDYERSESYESPDVDMEDDGSGSIASWDTESEVQ